MAEAQQIAVPGGVVPPLPAGAVSNENRIPAANQQTPGYVQTPQNQADQFVLPLTDAQKLAAAQVAGIDPAELAAFRAFKAAQAAAPAAAAVPAARPASTPTNATGGLDLAVRAASHDPILGSMLGIFDGTAAGVDRGRALGNALTHGDPALIDVAYLREVGGKDAERLVTIAQGIVQHCTAAAAQATASVFALAGGEANWDAATAAFNRSAPDHLKQFVKYSLDSGSASQVEAGAKAVVEFAKSSGLVATPGTGFVASGGGAPGSAQGLSKEAFQAAHAALDKNSRTYEREKGELYGRRQIGKQMGI